MARHKKDTYVDLIPKTDQGKKRASYHGTRWLLRQETTEPYRGASPGTWLAVRSSDGKAMLWVKKTDDTDFKVSVLQ
jgi:hypothetical protein